MEGLKDGRMEQKIECKRNGKQKNAQREYIKASRRAARKKPTFKRVFFHAFANNHKDK